MNRIELVNYNRLIEKDTDYVLGVLFSNNETLRKIAWYVLKYDFRLLDNTINPLILEEVVEIIELDDIWYLASLDKKYNIAKIAYNRVMKIIDDMEALENRNLIKILNSKMPS